MQHISYWTNHASCQNYVLQKRLVATCRSFSSQNIWTNLVRNGCCVWGKLSRVFPDLVYTSRLGKLETCTSNNFLVCWEATSRSLSPCTLLKHLRIQPLNSQSPFLQVKRVLQREREKEEKKKAGSGKNYHWTNVHCHAQEQERFRKPFPEQIAKHAIRLCRNRR